jgi:acyl carrier protein
LVWLKEATLGIPAADVATIQATVRDVVSEQLGLPPEAITATSDLRKLPGIESLKVLRIIARIERCYDIELDDEVVFGVTTVEELAVAIRDQVQAGAAEQED